MMARHMPACVGAALLAVMAIPAGLSAEITASLTGCGTLTVPDPSRLAAEAGTHWPSLIGRKERLAWANAITTLTTEHVRAARAAGVEVATSGDAGAWLAPRVATPAICRAERALMAGVLMQIDVLDALLSVRDPVQAAALRAARVQRRVRTDDERIFGDRRDHVFCCVVDALDDIADLQTALGDKETVTWTSPARGARQAEVERCVKVYLDQLAARAKVLR